uniref:Neuroglian n=1 Tax=Strigamia maritima TaxID=126957 RepID=T1JIY4_STRMM
MIPNSIFLFIQLSILSILVGSALVTPPSSPPSIIAQPPSTFLVFKVADTNNDEPIRPLQLDCEGAGEPAPLYKWIKNEQTFQWNLTNDRIVQQPGKGTLVFTNPIDEDEGSYQCLVENDYGIALSNKVIVRKLEKLIPPQSSNIIVSEVHEGAPLTLDCYLKRHIYWIIVSNDGSFETINNPRIMTDPEGRLQFSNVTIDDAYEKTYCCTAFIIVGDKISENDCKLEVKLRLVHAISSAATFTHEPIDQFVPSSSIVALKNDSLTLHCIFGGTPLPEIQWSKKNGMLPNGRHEFLNYGKTLHVSNVEFEDSGSYECVASNGVGERQYRNTYVSVAANPYWEIEPFNIIAPEDVTVEFTCNALGIPEPQIDWFVNGIPLIERTRITTMPNDYHGYVYGPSASLRCVTYADSTLDVTIEWLEDGKLIDFDADHSVILNTDHSIIIKKTDEPYRGVYTCVARTRLDSISVNATYTIRGCKNKFYIALMSTKCQHSVARIKWQPQGDNYAPINGYAIEYNTSFTPDSWQRYSHIPATDLELSIYLSPWSTCSFRVRAKNILGYSIPSEISEACSSPSDVPHKNPDDVHCEGSTPTNLDIAWKQMIPMEHNAQGFFYRVHYRLNASEINWAVPIDIHDWKQTSYTVENVETFEPFVVKVESHNEMGQANVAAIEVLGYSGEDTPLEAPSNFTLIQVINSNTAEFSWEPVTLKSVRGNFRGYIFTIWTNSENKSTEHLFPPFLATAKIYAFKPYAVNHVQLRVYNKKYLGPATPVISFETPEGKPGPVAKFEKVAVGSQSLLLSWAKPNEPNGIITGYVIFYAKVEGTRIWRHKEMYILDPAQTRAKLLGLEEDTKYRVSIVAQNSFGTGSKYFIETPTTKSEKPGKPTFTWELLSTSPDDQTRTPVKVFWAPATHQPGGNHFFVQYKNLNGTTWTMTEIELLDLYSVIYLEPGSYNVRVASVDGLFLTHSDPEEIEI